MGFKPYGLNPLDFDESFVEKSRLYLTIIINAYFILLLNYYCIIISKSQIGFEIVLTQTILISVYLSIFDLLINGIIYVLDNIDNLFIFQLVITIVLGFIIAIIILRSSLLCLILCFHECFGKCISANCIKIICCVSLCRRINQFFFS